MLKQRLLTALIVLPLFLAALFYLESRWIAVLFGAMVVAGAWEWSALAGLHAPAARIGYVAALLAAGTAMIFWIAGRPGNVMTVAAVSAVFWLLALIELIRGRAGRFGTLGTPAGKLVSGVFVLLPTWACAYFLHVVDARAPMLLLWMLAIVWVADAAAYFAGTTIGRHKLAPSVSPGKTVEGVVGGLLAVVVVTMLAGRVVPGLIGESLLRSAVLGLIVAAVSVVGDLVESKFKRLAGVKDSGRLLPGHGGMLDRIDAVTSAAPAFVLGWYALFPGTR